MLGSAGCGHSKQGEQQGDDSGRQNAFSYQLGAEIPDMDPSTTTDVLSFTLITNVMEGLYRIDENEKPQPAHAEGVDISDDERTYTFALRDGIKWSNGEPVTSQDFKYSWLRAMDPDRRLSGAARREKSLRSAGPHGLKNSFFRTSGPTAASSLGGRTIAKVGASPGGRSEVPGAAACTTPRHRFRGV